MALQRVVAGGVRASWGAQGFAGARSTQYPLATVATGGGVACGAGIQRGDLAQAKIAAVYANSMEGYQQGRSHRLGLVGHRKEVAVQMPVGGIRKVREHQPPN